MRLIFFLLIAIVIVALLYFSQGYILLNDVTTTLDNPPALDRPMTSSTIDLNKKFYSHLQPLSLDLPPDKGYALVRKQAETMPGWKIVNEKPNDGILHATVRTPLLGFTDDISIRVEPTATGSTVHMRSKSRVGRGDLGANARRIQDFLQKVKKNASNSGPSPS